MRGRLGRARDGRAAVSEAFFLLLRTAARTAETHTAPLVTRARLDGESAERAEPEPIVPATAEEPGPDADQAAGARLRLRRKRRPGAARLAAEALPEVVSVLTARFDKSDVHVPVRAGQDMAEAAQEWCMASLVKQAPSCARQLLFALKTAERSAAL